MKFHRVSVSCWLILGGTLLSGCTGNQYEIDLTPTEHGIERSLTCWRSHSTDPDNILEFPDEELRRIAAAYGAQVNEQPADKHTFTHVFSRQLPNDLGGSGSYRRWETSLGNVSIYLERVRGSDDLLAEAENRQQAVDKLVDLLLGWLTEVLQQEDGFAKLREFVNTGFRRDLKNLSLYAWLAELVPEQDDQQQNAEPLIRAGYYFVERSYFSIEQLPEIVRACQEYEATGHSQSLLELLQRFVATKMGVDEKQRVPDCLNFMGHELALKKSIEQYLRATDDYARLHSEWEEAKAENPSLEQPAPAEVVSEQLFRAFLPSLFAPSDSLNVTLAAKRQPFMTNGQWDDKQSQVHWKRSILSGDETFKFPAMLFAIWSEPDKKSQQDRFGKVILDGDALGQYCFWHRSLDQAEIEQWETFLAGIAPNAQFRKQLKAFRFAHEPPATADDQNDDLAAPARNLIFAGMTDQ